MLYLLPLLFQFVYRSHQSQHRRHPSRFSPSTKRGCRSSWKTQQRTALQDVQSRIQFTCLSCRRDMIWCYPASNDAMSLHADTAHGRVCCSWYMRLVKVYNYARHLGTLKLQSSAGIPWAQQIEGEADIFVASSRYCYSASCAGKYNDGSGDRVVGINGASHAICVICALSRSFSSCTAARLFVNLDFQWSQQMFRL